MIGLVLRILFFYIIIGFFSGQCESSTLKLSPEGTEFVKQINDSFYISCFHPEATNVWWYRRGSKISGDFTRVHVERKVEEFTNEAGLFFSTIQSTDSGDYTCRGKINNKNESVSFFLRTFRPITFKDTPAVQQLTEHELGVIRCEAEGEPEPTLTWIIDGKQLSSFKGFKKLADGLLIANVSLEDENRDFICRASAVNNITSNIAIMRIKVEVLHEPKLFGPDEMEVYGFLGGKVNLTCEVSANPPADFKWYRNNTIFSKEENVTITQEKNKSKLLVSYVNNTWSENYTCLASNNAGHVRVLYNVHKITKPEPPKKAKVHTTTHNSLILDIHTPPSQYKKILGYSVQIMKKVDHDKGKAWELAREVLLLKDEPYEIKDLEPDTEYMVRVTTQNKAGNGDYTSAMKTKTLYGSAPSNYTISTTLVLLLVLFYTFNLSSIHFNI